MFIEMGMKWEIIEYLLRISATSCLENLRIHKSHFTASWKEKGPLQCNF